MKKLLFTKAILLLSFTSTFAQSFTEKIVGEWDLNDADNSIVTIYQDTDGFWYGKITETEVTASMNRILFSEGVFNEKEQQLEGIITIPKREITVDTTIKFENDKKLEVVGSKFFLYKTFYWTRG